MGFIVTAVAFNVFCSRALPLTKAVFVFVHIVGFFVFLVVCWVTSEHVPAKEAFTRFQDNGGWGNTGLSALVGDHHTTVVFSWSRRWCSHVRRAQRRLACTSICYDMGFGVQCNVGDDHAHHVMFLSRSRLARHCVGTKHRHTDWNSGYSSAVQFDELDCWHHCHDDIVDLLVTCWIDNECRCFLALGLGFCLGQEISILFLH